MKKQYEAPKWEIVTFSAEDMRMYNSCSNDCGDDCTHCYYLVCTPEDVIIG